MFILPTRGRPDALRDMLNKHVEMGMTEKLLIVVDGKYGTDAVGKYMDMSVEKTWPKNFEWLFVGTDMFIGPTLNMVFEKHPDEFYYGIITDNHIPETKEWDVKLVNTMEEQAWWMVSSNDGWQAPKRAHGALLLSGEIVRKLGYIAPADMNHMFIDDVWERIGTDSGKWHVCMDVMVRHLHPLNGTMKEDKISREAMMHMEHDGRIYQRWLNEHYNNVRYALGIGSMLDQPNDNRRKVVEADLRGKKLFIATPTHDGRVSVNFLAGIMDLQKYSMQYGFTFGFYAVSYDSILPRARNEILAQFLEKEYDYLLMIDSDIGFNGSDVCTLMSYAINGYEVVGAAGPARRKLKKYAAVFKNDTIQFDPNTEIAEALSVGTGFLLMSRDVVLKLTDKHGKFIDAQKGKPMPAVFNYDYVTDNGVTVLRGEDYTFCARWRALGGKIYVAPFISLTHTGQDEFTGCLGDIIEEQLKERNNVLSARSDPRSGDDIGKSVQAAE